MWDEEEGFFYDVLRTGDNAQRMKVRSMVGLLPLCVATVFQPYVFEKYPELDRRFIRGRAGGTGWKRRMAEG